MYTTIKYEHDIKSNLIIRLGLGKGIILGPILIVI